MKFEFICVCLILFQLSGCKKSDPPPDPPKKAEINKPPTSFAATVTKIYSNAASIEWTPTTDPENDKITYSIYLNNTKFADAPNGYFTYKIDGLVSEMYYAGYIRATDSKLNHTDAGFTFRTQKNYVRFSKVYGVNDNFSEAISIVENGNKGFIIAGRTVDSDLALVNIDSLGNEIWRKTYPYINSFDVKIKRTNDNGYIIAGFRYVLKLSTDGEKLWDYIVSYDDNDSQNESIIQTNDNGYLVVGTGYENITEESQASLTKLDADGKFQWIKYFGKPQMTLGFYIEKTSDGNFLILGSTLGSNMHIYLIKVDNNGQSLWIKTLNAGSFSFPKQIKMTKDNGFVIVSYCFASNRYTPRIVKIDNDGNIQWDQYLEKDALSARSNAICQTADGGYAIAGLVNKPSDGLYDASCLLLKLKSDGTFDWDKAFHYEDSMDYWWNGFDILQTKDNGFLISGKKGWINSPPQKDWGFWILKTDPTGEFN